MEPFNKCGGSKRAQYKNDCIFDLYFSCCLKNNLDIKIIGITYDEILIT